MATTTMMDTPSFTMGGVASATFGSIGRNFLTFTFLALLAEVPIQVLAWYTNQFQVNATSFTANPSAAITYFSTIIASSFLAIFMAYVLQAAIVYGTVTDLSGRRASFGSSLGTALKVFFPLVGLSIVSTLGVGVGTILVIVPGIILALGWSVAVPVRVVERTSVFDALGRSWTLTSGYKGTIFFLALIFALAGFMFSLLGMSFAGVFSFTRPAVTTAFPIGYFVYSGVIRALEAMVGGAGIATIYYQLRAIKEGIAPEQLAAVFD